MGLRWYKQVWADGTLRDKPASHRLAMLAIAEFANDDTGQCWPSIETLSTMICLQDRQTQRVLKSLSDDGYITIEVAHGRNRSNVYTITEKVSSTTEKVSSTTEKGVLDDTRTNIEPSIEPSIVDAIAQPSDSSFAKKKVRAKVGGEQTPADKARAELTKAILAAYVEVRGGNGINYGKEGAAAKKLASEKRTPEQVKNCYLWLKAKPFWADKPLSLNTIFENLPEYERMKVQASPESTRPRFVNGKEQPPEGMRIVNLYG